MVIERKLRRISEFLFCSNHARLPKRYPILTVQKMINEQKFSFGSLIIEHQSLETRDI